jgi:hypothetical protein
MRTFSSAYSGGLKFHGESPLVSGGTPCAGIVRELYFVGFRDFGR